MQSSDFVTNALAALTSHGYKNTRTRRRIINHLATITGPINPYDITTTDPSLDTVTVYRTLDILTSLHIIHKLHSINAYIRLQSCHHNSTPGGETPGETPGEKTGTDHDHVHILHVCLGCQSLLSQHITTMHFADLHPDHHCYEIIGRCTTCHTPTQCCTTSTA